MVLPDVEMLQREHELLFDQVPGHARQIYSGCWIAGRSNLILFTFTSAEFGPFSSVWTATIVRVGAFFRIFRDLQDLHSFAPLRIRKFSKFSSNFFMIFAQISQNFAVFRSKSLFFARILMKFCRNLTRCEEIVCNLM